MSEREDGGLEAPAHLGRPLFEEQRAVSERSVGSVGLLAVLALVAAIVSFTAGETAFGWIALALFALACPGFALLVRRLVHQQRAEERGRRPRVLP
ncbi:MAG TPA: hypothetical protein VIN00_00825 [Candidatus Dormibacteraeota bacterium]|jgi:peptidoglycan/LPS O-acetylase OafA/YrhL